MGYKYMGFVFLRRIWRNSSCDTHMLEVPTELHPTFSFLGLAWDYPTKSTSTFVFNSQCLVVFLHLSPPIHLSVSPLHRLPISLRLHQLPVTVNISQVFYLSRQISKIRVSYRGSTMYRTNPFSLFRSLHASSFLPHFFSLLPFLLQPPSTPCHSPFSEARHIVPLV